MVVAAVVWNLFNLRAETVSVANGNDRAMHAEMVRFATAQWRKGHLPLTTWFPNLGLGSPHFLHYQSLPAMITGLIGVATGPNTAFCWSTYLLVSMWPVSVYLGARVFGLKRWSAACSAAIAPFLYSQSGVGYEQRAYLWSGFGLWAQLWASVTLPLAWGFTWRAIRTGRRFVPAVALVAVTMALHFETGYLALLPLLGWPLVAGRPKRLAVRRAALIGLGAMLVAAWVLVPLAIEGHWAATNEIYRSSPYVNGYGAGRVTGWLVTGQLLDSGRLPVVTVLAFVGLGLALVRWRTDAPGRAVTVAFASCLVLSFGRTTFGPLVDVIPGNHDVFFRRFMMGGQLGALLLAGIGASSCWSLFTAAVAEHLPVASKIHRTRPQLVVQGAVATAVVILLLAPAWLQLHRLDKRNAYGIAVQHRADLTQGADVADLVATALHEGGGRVYAGLPTNWGSAFRVGQVSVYAFLTSLDVDEVGFTLRTTSLMTTPEYFFDESNPSDYSLFGVRYLLLPLGHSPPVEARFVRCESVYCLWTVYSRGYVGVGRIVGTLSADRTNLGRQTLALLRTSLSQHQEYLSVAFGRRMKSSTHRAAPRRRSSVGVALSEHDALDQGRLGATVHMSQPGVAVLSASFDPGWHATVDGQRVPVSMVAPALVSVPVGSGTHSIAFHYQGFGAYPELILLGILALAALFAVDARVAHRSAQASSGGDDE